MMKPNPSALKVAQLTQRLAAGYYAYAAAIKVAQDPRAKALFTEILPGQSVPIEFVSRKDGTTLAYHFQHYLDQVRSGAEIADDLQHTWLVGTLLAIGDALLRHGYFDRAPELELIY